MSTKFYIKNDNGNILSMDGKTRYTLLEGKAAYDLESSTLTFTATTESEDLGIGVDKSLYIISVREFSTMYCAMVVSERTS